MINRTDEQRSRRNRAVIRDTLMQEWDPIGVRNIPGAPADEYDAYIDAIYSLLTDPHPSQEQIAAFLLETQSRRMALCISDAARERCSRAAGSLIAARVKLAFPTE